MENDFISQTWNDLKQQKPSPTHFKLIFWIYFLYLIIILIIMNNIDCIKWLSIKTSKTCWNIFTRFCVCNMLILCIDALNKCELVHYHKEPADTCIKWNIP